MKGKQSKKDSKKIEKKVEEKSKINLDELIMQNMSNPQTTIEYQGIQFIDLDLSNKSIDSLSNSIQNYKFLQNINLSGNNLSDFSILTNLPNLITIDLSQNNIKELKSLYNEEAFKYLKTINLQKNRITEIAGLKPPNLIHLNLNDNLIDKLEAFEGHSKLRKLELRQNKINSTQTIANMPELKELYLSNNRIKAIIGLELPSLTILHLRGNQIEAFEETFPALDNLVYFNIRENKLDKMEEFLKLQALPNLRTFIYSFNPVVPKNPMYLFDTINCLLKLTRINKVHITKGIKRKAFAYAQEKWQQEEEKKRMLEEEERIRQEQEAQQDQQND